jgi:hypothetical protein
MAISKKSKFFAASLTAAVTVSAVAPTILAAELPEDSQNLQDNEKEALALLMEAGVVKGDADTGDFRPGDSINRAEASVMLSAILELDVDNAPAADFPDVDQDAWYAKYVNAVATEGIVVGDEEGNFNWDSSLTRAEFAQMVFKAYGLEATTAELPFEDLVEDAWYTDAIATLYANDIIAGQTETTFGPNESIRRVDTARLLAGADLEFGTYLQQFVKAEAPAVKSVDAINATEVVVEFSVLVDKESAETEANYAIGANAPSTATLNGDGKSVTLKFAAASQVEVKNAVFVVEPIKTAADTTVQTPKFTKVFSYEDTVRPTVNGVSYPTNSTAKVTLSEAVNVLDGAALEEYITITNSNGAEVSDSGLFTLSSDKKSFTVNTATFKKDETYTLAIVGLKDLGDNLISPNPAEVSITKTEVDTVKPKIESVTALDTDKFKVVLSEAIDTTSVYFTYEINGNGTTVPVNSGNATINGAKTEFIVDLGTTLAGPNTVKIVGYADPSGNEGAVFSKLVDFKADTTKPSVVSTKVETVDNVRYIAVEFSEEVTLNPQDLNFSFIQDGVLNTGKISASALSLADLNKDKINETLLINTEASELKSGEYTIALPSALVADTSQNTNSNNAASVKVTLGELTSNDTTKPGISELVIQEANNNTIEVSFSEEVSNETALNLANYTVEGKQVFSKAVFIGNKSTVRLTLNEGAVKLNGDYQLEISNIQDKAGNVLDAYKVTKALTENTTPALASAVLTANDVITLTFNENINVGSIVEDTSVADFKVLVNGVEETGVVEASTNAKTFTLKLADPLTSAEYNSTITIKPTADFDVEDVNGNRHKTFDSVTVAK